MLKNTLHLLKALARETNLVFNGYYSWKVIVGVQGKLRIFEGFRERATCLLFFISCCWAVF